MLKTVRRSTHGRGTMLSGGVSVVRALYYGVICIIVWTSGQDRNSQQEASLLHSVDLVSGDRISTVSNVRIMHYAPPIQDALAHNTFQKTTFLGGLFPEGLFSAGVNGGR